MARLTSSSAFMWTRTQKSLTFITALSYGFRHLLQRVLIYILFPSPSSSLSLFSASPSASRCPHIHTTVLVRLKTSSASTTGWARRSAKVPSVLSSRVRLLTQLPESSLTWHFILGINLLNSQSVVIKFVSDVPLLLLRRSFIPH